MKVIDKLKHAFEVDIEVYAIRSNEMAERHNASKSQTSKPRLIFSGF
jgi:hypothetical protein